ncbi:MAG: uroporphyrinogen-III synthase [Deltaproteobacteria bacterium]|jgi:uroporphyrinogen III methyltransferase/synthase|nr:uroporphyrinogen-III synthase [Deltaproteobacteria bacterium]
MPSKGRELDGRTVLVTRAPEQAGALSEALRDRGAEVLELPTILIVPPETYAPLDQALSQASSYDALILGSRNAAQGVVERCLQLGLHWPRPIACVGEKTAHWVRSQAEIFRGEVIVPQTFRAEALVPTLVAHFGEVEGRRFLHPRAPEGRETIGNDLGARGARVEAVEAYRIQAAPPLADPERLLALAAVDWVTFLSGETLKAFLAVVPEARAYLAARKVAVIGPVAAERAEKLGVRVDLIPPEATVESLVQGLAAFGT